MPTYEFRCPKGHEFTRFYKTISAGVGELPCPECGEVAARQLSGGAGLVFKGSGFYLTDYGKNAHRGSKGESSKGESSKGESSKGESSKGEGSKTEGSKSEGQKAAASGQSTPPPPKVESPKPKGSSE